MAEFKNFTPDKASVRRDGEDQWKEMEPNQLVPGDIVKLTMGQQIPADVILFRANEMKVNNASLTGESEDILKNPAKNTPNIFESPNCAFFGTNCTGGSGEGMVFKTGDNTVMGRIAGLAQSADAEETTLNRDIKKFILIISSIAIFLGILFFCLGMAMKYTLITGVIFAIGIIVANVPEGLLVTVTVALALTSKRMYEKQVQVNNMEAIETLGSTTCICSDKTGTLTQNRMTVSQMFIGPEIDTIDCSVNYEIFKRFEEKEKNKGDQAVMANVPMPKYDVKNKVFKTLIETIALGTVSYFTYEPSSEELRKRIASNTKTSFAKVREEIALKDEDVKEKADYATAKSELIHEEVSKAYIKRAVKGDASETGLVKFVQTLLMDGKYGCYNVEGGLDGYRKKHDIFEQGDGASKEKVQIPFSSEIKFNMMVRNVGNELFVYLKGAPERVVKRCDTILMGFDGEGNDVEQVIDDEMAQRIESANKKFGG